MPYCNLPFIKFIICSFKGIIADQVPGIMKEGNQDRVGSNNDLDIALHSEVPNILVLRFTIFEIFLVSINYTCDSTVSTKNEETKN